MTLVVDLPDGYLPVPGSATTAFVLAQPPPPEDPGGQGEEFGKSSPIALVILILFFVATLLLVRSMNKHLRGLPESFDEPDSTDKAEDGRRTRDGE